MNQTIVPNIDQQLCDNLVNIWLRQSQELAAQVKI